MKINIELTWSKLMALLVLSVATYLDLCVMNNNSTIMYALPFVVFLITGKQFFDKGKN